MARKIFDIHDCFVEFVEGNDGKYRPILIIDWNNQKPGFVLFYKITTQYENKPTHIKDRYYPIRDWEQANLEKQSYVDIFKLHLLEVGVLTAERGKYRGRMTDWDIEGFRAFYESKSK